MLLYCAWYNDSLRGVAEKGVTYEFWLSAQNDEDFGIRAIKTIKTPDGSEWCARDSTYPHAHYLRVTYSRKTL